LGLKDIPVYTEFLKHVKGLGARLSCKLLALDLDINKDLSSWNAYFGLTPNYWKAECTNGHKRLYAKEPYKCLTMVNGEGEDDEMVFCDCDIKQKEFIANAPRRTKGYLSYWNPQARALYYLIATSFMKGGNFYKAEYQKRREALTNAGKGKRESYFGAMRHAFKLFLAHYYQATAELAGVEYRLPYSFEYLNHKNFISWREVVSRENGNKTKKANKGK